MTAPAPTRADLAHQVLFWSAVVDQAKEQAAGARTALEQDARRELEQTGAAPTWRIPGIGTVPLALTLPQVVVDNPAAYAAWVAARYPTEVEPRVRDAFDHQLRKAVAELGDPPVDPGTGEAIPGLRYVPGGEPRGVSVRPVGGAKDRFAAEARQMLGLDPKAAAS